jgi:hypothetical protein
MAGTKNTTNFTREPALPIVSLATVEQFERTTHDNEQLYKNFFKENPDLALWLRRKIVSLYPDIADREAAASLALETMAMLGNQNTVNNLNQLFKLNPPLNITVKPKKT